MVALPKRRAPQLTWTDYPELLREGVRPAGARGVTVQAGLASGEDGRAIVEVLKAARDDYRHTVQDRFEKAVVDGDLPAGTDCKILARFLMATAEGLAVNAAADAPREELLAAAILAAQMVPAN